MAKYGFHVGIYTSPMDSMGLPTLRGGVSMEKLVTIGSMAVYNLFRGRNQPTYNPFTKYHMT